MPEPGDPCLLNLQPAFSDFVMRSSELGPSLANLFPPASAPSGRKPLIPVAATPATEDPINCLRDIPFLAIAVLFLPEHSRMKAKHPLRIDPAQAQILFQRASDYGLFAIGVFNHKQRLKVEFPHVRSDLGIIDVASAKRFKPQLIVGIPEMQTGYPAAGFAQQFHRVLAAL